MADKRELPPSVSAMPGLSDREIEDEAKMRLLGQAIDSLPRGKGVVDFSVAVAARWLLDEWWSTQGERRLKKKRGTASRKGVETDLKKIASKSKTLLKQLKQADRKTFELWAYAAVVEDGVECNQALQEWLTLKRLLAYTTERADVAARTANISPNALPPDRSKDGRPPEEAADYITTLAAHIYEALTEAKANRVIDPVSGQPIGNFHEFLEKVFKVLGIKASANACNIRFQQQMKNL